MTPGGMVSPMIPETTPGGMTPGLMSPMTPSSAPQTPNNGPMTPGRRFAGNGPDSAGIICITMVGGPVTSHYFFHESDYYQTIDYFGKSYKQFIHIID